jgi:Domain of unknown function (DUF4124)
MRRSGTAVPLPAWVVGAILACGVCPPVGAQKIYTCVDAQGRRLTSDRPIVECMDREQRELGRSGTVRRVVPPAVSLADQARRDTEKKEEEEAKAREKDGQRKLRALATRYPEPALHDRHRAQALAQIDLVIEGARKRVETLQRQRKDIDVELEFYKGDVSKAPPWLQRKVDDNARDLATQQRLLSEQMAERQRINARFDEEQVQLKPFWAGGPTRP